MKLKYLIKLSAVVTVLVFQAQGAIALDTFKYDILADINKYREDLNLLPLEKSLILCQLATTRLNQIKKEGDNWSHKEFQSELNKLPYNGTYYENLARSNNLSNIPVDEPSTIVHFWKTSKKGHNQALLTDLDFGCVAYDAGYYVFEGYKKQSELDKMF